MDNSDAAPRTWTVGDLARACGVTVRTLHHYDRLGIVTASARTSAGHRRYSEHDVRRLYQVLALRQLGLGLAAIQAWLAADSDLVGLIRQHLDAVDHEVRRFELLRGRLERLLTTWEHTGHVTTNDLLNVMEEMTMYDDHLDPDQLNRLEHDRRQLDYPGIDPWRANAALAIAALRAAYEAGAEPSNPDVQDLVDAIRDLRQQFSGRDPGISRSLKQLHEDQAWDDVRAIVPADPELRAFWKRARDAANA